jgi:hypothetical protein
MSGAGLRYFIVGLRLNSMDQVGKLDGILDEENRNGVANNVYYRVSQIPLICGPRYFIYTIIALIGVKTQSKSMNVSGGVDTSSGTSNS